MTPERWQQVKRIFNSAISYPIAQRDEFLSHACSGDEALRGEVESLLAAHEKSEGFSDEHAFKGESSWSGNAQGELKIGQMISSYEILSFLSKGGMGEVYLAEDKRLNRKVALKLLPFSYTSDPARLKRFEQEARTASALNHPNIITIFEITETGDTRVIATEFVEGETLRQRLTQSGLSLSEALNIAVQIADALSAAHKVGIIHRDIKPENIMLRPDGYVKVLDFGLAKLIEQTSDSIASEAPTVQALTGAGVVMGTAGYMSPEQARGFIVDSRTDIFSLGAVIYEMVARRKPFEGETPSDTLASILKSDPVPLSRLVPEVPAELVRIITKSLRKDREERYQVVKDLWLDLKTLKQDLDFQEQLDRSLVPDGDAQVIGATELIDSTQALPKAADTRSAISNITDSLTVEIRRHKVGAVVATLGVALVLAAGIFGLYKYLNRPRVAPAFANVKLVRLTNSGNVIDSTLSPDGKYLVYVLSDRTSQSVWIRQTTTANDKQIVPPAPVGFFGLAFSPDGTELYYAVKSNLDSGTLYRIPVLGGTPVKVLEKIDSPVSFAPDGKRFALIRGNFPTPGESALVIASVEGGPERTLVVKKLPERFAPIFFAGPSWSIDDKLIALSVHTIGGKSRLCAYSTADGSEQEITKQRWSFAGRVQWLPDMSGLLLIAGENPGTSQVWFVAARDGESRRITNDLSGYRTISLAGDAKKFATVQSEGLVNLWVAPEGDEARSIRLPTGNIGFFSSSGVNISWSNGQLVYVSNEGGHFDIWTANTDGSNRKQLTTGSTPKVNPSATADGRYIVFNDLDEGSRSIWRINLDGSNPVQLTHGPADSFPSLTADSKWIVYTVLAGPKPTLWKVSIDGGTPVQVSDHVAVGGVVSPDGKLIAYAYPASTDAYAPPNRIDVAPFEGTGPIKTFEVPASVVVAGLLQWSKDGKILYYTVTVNNVTNIFGQPLDGGPAKQITRFRDSLMPSFAWSPDGKQLACTRGVLVRDAVMITEVP